MSRVVELLRSRRVPQVAVLALMSVGFAGCSADMQTRLSDNSFSNPFASQPEATGSVPHARRRAPRAAAIFPAAGACVAIPVPGPAAARGRGAALLSGQLGRRVGRRARDFVLCAAGPSADRDHRHGAAALGRGRRARPRRAAPRSSSAPATRSTFWRSATTFRPPRSCRPMATRARARCRPASN